MTGPDPWGDNGARTRNRVDENFGTSVQAGQAYGDVNVGTSRTTTISLPAVSVIIGSVLTLVIVLAVWKLAGAENSPGAAPATTSPSLDTSPQPETSTRSSAPAVAASPAKEVRLQRNTGVDVDGNDTRAKRADGLSGQTDLHLDGFNVLFASSNSLSVDHGDEKGAKARCTEAAAGDGSKGPALPGMAGLQYCFVTSDNRVAWIRVQASTLATFDSSAYVVLAVRVW